MRYAVLSIFVTAALLLSVAPTTAQVSADPIRVVLGPQQPSTEMRLTNTDPAPVEVSTSVDFGVYVSDDLGAEHLDSVGNDFLRSRSCSKWVRVFPARFIMKPKESRTIRVIAVPPPDLADGEYTARLRITSVKLEKPTAAAALDSNQVAQTQIRQYITIGHPLMFRKGKLTTSIAMDSVWTHTDSAKTYILVQTTHGGNSAYRGDLMGRLYSPAGEPLDSADLVFMVEDHQKRVRVGFDSLAPGTYRLDLSATIITHGGIGLISIPAEPVYRSFDLIVTGGDAQLIPRSDDPIYMPQPRRASAE